MLKYVGLFSILMLFLSMQGEAQVSKDTVDFTSLSFEDLMTVKIISASKKSENLFDAPLSASVLSKEEIDRSGATTIMEALRLIPGLIVRQLTNGNYDIHIRGLDNVPPNSLRLNSSNTTTLVMIDNRPVYNYQQGGIFWETLTIGLSDIEKIEVIRGPSSTLYGPNAVSGVINIITNKIEKNGLMTRANIQYGSMNTFISNAGIGYRFNKKLSASITGNYQSRGREVIYQDLFKQKWYTSIDSLSTSNPSREYPHPDRSMIKQGANLFLQFAPKEKIEFNLSSGFQQSEVQTSNFDSFTSNINTFTSKSQYVDLRTAIGGLTTQVSYNHGNQHTILGFKTSVDFSITDLNAEYSFQKSNFSIKPGIAYRSAIYDDTKRGDITKREGTLNGRRSMETFGGTIRSEYNVWDERIRVTGGIRADRFTYPGDWFFSYQAASSIKINKNNIFRIVYSNAYRSPFIYDTYQDIQLTMALGTVPEMYMVNNMLGNKDLSPLNSKMFEIGYRSKFNQHVSIDLEGYTTKTENFTGLVTTTPLTETPESFPFIASFESHTYNIPLSVRQTGASLSINVQFKKFQFKPFVTLQKTTLYNYSHYANTSNVSPDPSNNFDPATYNIYSGMGTEMDHRFTPKVYGGAYANYQMGKFNMNVTVYYFGSHTFYHSFNLYFPDGRGIGQIDSKAIVNAKVMYTPFKAFSIFVNAKNILNDKSREYFLSDETPAMIFGGVSLSL